VWLIAILGTRVSDSPQEQSLKTHGRSFHWARRLLGEVHADRATRLYAFCREIDDIADEAESSEVARARLLQILDAIERGQVKEPWLLEAMLLCRESRIASWVPAELVRGVLWDLDAGQIQDEAELLAYCFRVAGTVGIMMSGLLDVTEPNALAHAVDLGIGMQMTNIARDVSRDGRIGRRYLPGTWVGSIDPQMLVDPSPELRPLLRSSVRRLLMLAEHYYASGLKGLSYLPGNARMGIGVAARVYREIGAEILRLEGDCWQRHVVVSPSRKLALTTLTLVSPLGSPDFYKRPGPHDRALHQHLRSFPISQGLVF
jgi:15-cis-phytoene synthase